MRLPLMRKSPRIAFSNRQRGPSDRGMRHISDPPDLIRQALLFVSATLRCQQLTVWVDS